MNYIIENDFLKVTVSDLGAEPQSIILKKDGGREALWQANAEGYWQRRAPILFPHCGKLVNDSFSYNGQTYKSTAHGFLRDMVFKLKQNTPDKLVFAVGYNSETLQKYPFKFYAQITFTLNQNTLVQGFSVTNQGENEMYFNMGYHPAFNCPFDAQHTAADYSFVFEKDETPMDIVHSMQTGYNTGERKMIFENKHIWPITENMFQNDSLAMDNLNSAYVKLQENNSNRAVKLDIKDFPFVLFWSCLKTPIKFICIEPWHGINAFANATPPISEKYAVKTLAPSQSFSANLPITFITE